jgi:hypothetical protein
MATLNLGSLTKYTDQLSGILLKEAVLVGNTFDFISVQTGIKYADSINLLTNTLTAAAGGCGTISPTGSTTLTQRDITVCPIKVEESICVDEFEQYWIGQLAKEGSYNEFAPEAFNQLYLANKVEKVGQLVEDIFWKGSVNSTYGGGNLALCNGMLHILEGTSATNSVITTTFSGALTTANALDVVDDMIRLLPNDVLDANDLTLFMSHANFRVLMNALRNNNYFFGYDGVSGHTWVLENYTNTNVRIVATRGLNGRNEMVLTPASNLFFGTDSFGEARNGDGFQFWYDIRDNITYFRAKLKVGAQVAFPAYIVIKNS